MRIERPIALVAAILLLTMFLVSSVYKFSDLDTYTSVLDSKLHLPDVSRFLIVCAALLQLFASLILIGFFGLSLKTRPHPWLRTLAMLSCVGLIVFTVVATLMFKVPSFDASKPWPLLSNVSVTGGLVLMALQVTATA